MNDEYRCPDLECGREKLINYEGGARCTTDALDVLLCRLVTRASLAHLALLSSLDESESLHYLNPATCLMVADGEHLTRLILCKFPVVTG